jgi:predicted nucleic acid-binding Zn ribbon protein
MEKTPPVEKESLRQEVEIYSFNVESLPPFALGKTGVVDITSERDRKELASWILEGILREKRKLVIREVRDESGNIIERVALNQVFMVPEGSILNESSPLAKEVERLRAILGDEGALKEAERVFHTPGGRTRGHRRGLVVSVRVKRKCAYCGKAFEVRRADQKFCSASCKTKAYLNRKKGLERKETKNTLEVAVTKGTCSQCGGALEYVSSDDGERHELVCQNCGLVYQRDDRGLGSYVTEKDLIRIVRRQPSEAVLETVRIKRRCLNCGREFYIKQANQLYCSSICQKSAKNKRYYRRK